MKRVIRYGIIALGAMSAMSACSSSLDTSLDICPSGEVCVSGTVDFVLFEGGFWAISGDDNQVYEPLGGLPQQYRDDGLRVYLQGRIREDVFSVHMAGPIIEITRLRALR